MTNLSGKPVSFWIDSTLATTYLSLENSVSVDVAIASGGKDLEIIKNAN
ncbi:hypothetical protein [Anabaena catenula]|uniref:Uncharacterized protein n=1 Tax=Anabaena catenula FACHB-362 TaxID=2692877 RepID=A0ABR8J265_9NOST|nr:hypothetical protein [Anabaena catenula]MBD2691151.1 hypothetical protein [Anabaena catenula FACHB-362]